MEKLGLKKSTDNTQNYVLIIDEINRGNISKIFGELITLLEKDKRINEENEITVTLPYSQEKFGVPSNLYIIGTMNTADRSIGQIDYALRRRFAFVSLKSDKSVLENYDKYKDDAKNKAISLFDTIQTFIIEHINEDLDAEDLMIGHSYFLCETEDNLKQRLEYEILPLIKEYEKDGIIMVDKKDLNDKITEWTALL
jgi:5-methylcytosine-specific restriction protein B